MIEAGTSIRNAWYVAGWDAEVASVPLDRTICGMPMLFYRRLDGSVLANRELRHDAYQIDQGGVRVRQIIARRIRERKAAA